MTAGTLEIDAAFRALADGSRRDILSRLSERPMSVKDLAEPTSLTLAAVVQHVQLLEASGLVTTRKAGRVRTCTLNAEAVSWVEDWLAERRRTWETRLDRLGAVLDQQDSAEEGR